jgi:peptidoglycan/LPS O-acetylase OafA/YrhL
MRLGKISFSAYLVHFPIFMKMREWEGWRESTTLPEVNFLIFSMVGWIVSIVLGGLLYKCIETPGIRIGKYFIAKLPA